MPGISIYGYSATEPRYGNSERYGVTPSMLLIIDSSGNPVSSINAEMRTGLQWTLNQQGGCGSASFLLDRTFENTIGLNQGTRIEVWRNAQRLWSGIIDQLERVVPDPKQDREYIRVVCVGYVTRCEDVIVSMNLKGPITLQTALTRLVNLYPVPGVAGWTIPALTQNINEQDFKEVPFSEAMSSLVGQATDVNGKPYLWGIDQDRQGYVKALPSTQVDFYLAVFAGNDADVSNYLIYDGPYRRIKNRLKCYGAVLDDGRQLVAIINESTSQTTYGVGGFSGIKETVLTNPNIRNLNDLITWGTAQAKVLGYPRDTGNFSVYPLQLTKETYRPWNSQARVYRNASGAYSDHNIQSVTFSDRLEKEIHADFAVENHDIVWWEIFQRQPQLRDGRIFANSYDQSREVTLRDNNFVLVGGALTITTITNTNDNARIDGLAARIAGSNITTVAIGFQVGVALTANKLNDVWLTNTGVWTIKTDGSNVTNAIKLYQFTCGPTAIEGWRTLFRFDATNPGRIVVASDGSGHVATIQDALTLAPSGGKIFIKSALTISSQITINKIIVIEGQKDLTALNLVNSATLGNFPNGYIVSMGSGSEGTVIRNLDINGNKANNAGNTFHGVYVTNKSLLENVEIFDCTGKGIVMASGSKIAHCFVNNNDGNGVEALL